MVTSRMAVTLEKQPPLLLAEAKGVPELPQESSSPKVPRRAAVIKSRGINRMRQQYDRNTIGEQATNEEKSAVQFLRLYPLCDCGYASPP